MNSIRSFLLNRPLILMVLGISFAVSIQILLLQSPPYHDIVYRSSSYLNSETGALGSDSFSSPHSPLTWSSDWKRQLYLHPPGNYATTWAWINVWGDSPLSLGMLSLIVGWMGMMLWHRLIKKVWNSKTADAVFVLCCFSSSFLWYSVMPVDAIFEFAVMPLGLLGILRLYWSGQRKDIWGAFFLQCIALLFSYHYLLALGFSIFLTPLRRSWGKKIACVALCVFASTWIIHGIGNGAYKLFWPHWPDRIGLITLLNWYAELPVWVLHWETPKVNTIVKWLSVLMLIGIATHVRQSMRRGVDRRKELLLFSALLPLVAYSVLITFLGSFGHQRNFFYLLPLFCLFLVTPFITLKSANLIVTCIAVVIGVSGVTFLKTTTENLFRSQAPLYAALSSSSLDDTQCIAIETKREFYASNSYIQSSKLHPYRVRWFTKGELATLCADAKLYCKTTTIFTSQDFSNFCTVADEVSVLVPDEILPPIVRPFLEIDGPVRVYKLTSASESPRSDV